MCNSQAIVVRMLRLMPACLGGLAATAPSLAHASLKISSWLVHSCAVFEAQTAAGQLACKPAGAQQTRSTMFGRPSPPHPLTRTNGTMRARPTVIGIISGLIETRH
eukprot:363634-Chlamydomonas_euryale.AAC.18